MTIRRLACIAAAFPLVVFLASCSRQAPAAAAAVPQHHEHRPPHGGTPVVLGDEVYHLELVRDAERGVLQVFVLDGEMEEFIRSAMPSFEIVATVAGEARTLTCRAIADPATGERVGDTALFEASADWLKATTDFDGVITAVDIRGAQFSNIAFNFPKGNDADED